MAKSDTVDYKVKLAIDSKEYRAALRAANAEAKQFKKQQKESFLIAAKGASDSMGMVISAVKKLAPAFAAGGAAYKVLNTAMKENQTWTDEWARVTESARASYEAFANTLVSGNFSGFFSNMREIISTAREAADAFDALGTNRIFNSKEMAMAQAEADFLKYQLKRDDITPEERERYKQMLQANSQRQFDISRSQINQSYMTSGAALVSEFAKRGIVTSVGDNIVFNAQTGMNEIKKGSLFEKYFGSLDEYNRWAKIYQEETALRAKNSTFTPGGGFSTGQWIEGRGNLSEAAYRELEAAMQMSDETLQQLFSLLTEAASAQSSYYTRQGENLELMRRNPNAVGGGGAKDRTPAPEGSLADLREDLKKAQQEFENATTEAAREAARAYVKELKLQIENIELGPPKNFDNVLLEKNFSDGTPLGKNELPQLNDLTDIKFDKKDMGGIPKIGKGDVNSLEDYASALYSISDAFGMVSASAGGASDSFSSIANIAGSLTGVVEKLLPIIALEGAMGKGFPANLIAVTGFISAALAAISTISNAKFASGGIVGGTSYRGDRLTANVNSGEMILTRQQQRNLFDAISSGDIGGGGSGAALVRGEDIYVSLSNYMRRSGRRLL